MLAGLLIFNISVLSKVIEHLAARHLTDYIKEGGLFPMLQSGFSPLHSTEAAALKVLSDLLEAVDHGDSGILVLLDLPAAFDRVNHIILLQVIRLSADSSDILPLLSGVPQRSVLGPLLFILYTVNLIELAGPLFQ